MGPPKENQRKLIRINKAELILKENLKSPKIRKKMRKLDYYSRNKISAKNLSMGEIRRNNKYERLFKELLTELDINHIWQQPFFNIDRYVSTDFYLPDQNVVIELDGSVHEEMMDYDSNRTIYLKNVHGVSDVLRITNKQLIHKTSDVRDLLLSRFKIITK